MFFFFVERPRKGVREEKQSVKKRKSSKNETELTVRRVVVHAGGAGDVDTRAAVPACFFLEAMNEREREREKKKKENL